MEAQLSDRSPEFRDSHKAKHWQETAAEAAKITDRLGKPIDKGIFEAVVALNVLDINTTGSCEGHLEHGTGAPYIDIKAGGLEDLELKVDQAFERAQSSEDKEDIPPETKKRLFEEYHALRRELQKRHLEETQKLFGPLEDFYRDRQVPYDTRLILRVFGRGTTRVESQGALFQETADEKVKQDKLSEYQKEMAAFSAFLKECYASS
jgi:hypothetical protein